MHILLFKNEIVDAPISLQRQKKLTCIKSLCSLFHLFCDFVSPREREGRKSNPGRTTPDNKNELDRTLFAFRVSIPIKSLQDPQLDILTS